MSATWYSFRVAMSFWWGTLAGSAIEQGAWAWAALFACGCVLFAALHYQTNS